MDTIVTLINLQIVQEDQNSYIMGSTFPSGLRHESALQRANGSSSVDQDIFF